MNEERSTTRDTVPSEGSPLGGAASSPLPEPSTPEQPPGDTVSFEAVSPGEESPEPPVDAGRGTGDGDGGGGDGGDGGDGEGREPPDENGGEPDLTEEIEKALGVGMATRIAGGLWALLFAAGIFAAGVALHGPVTALLSKKKGEAPAASASKGQAPAGEGATAGHAGEGEGAGGEAVQSEGEEPTKYTCGMHPQIVQDEPGYCPICGMKLTPVKKSKKKHKKKLRGEQACKGRKILWWEAPMDPNYRSDQPGKSPMGMDLVPVCESDEEEAEGGISIDSRIRQNMGIRTRAVWRGPLVKRIRTVGHVDYDETRFAVINTKVSGWVERLYVDYTGQEVHKGDKLLALYSPDLIATQEELLLAAKAYKRTANDHDKALLESARRRLRYWDISKWQIRRIERTGKVQRRLTVYAPMDGVVVHKNVFEGQFVKAGADLFRIADLSKVWVYVHIYEQDVPFVRKDQEVTIDLPYEPGRVLHGRVDYVFPWLDRKTRDVKARLVFDNSHGLLKPQMYVTAWIHSRLSDGEVLLVDDSAIIRSGVRNVVFVETEPGTYEPRQVKLGRAIEGAVEVLDGLKEGEKVVVNGQFMLDSESRLKEALSKFEKPEEAAQAGKGPSTPEEKAAALDELEAQGCEWTCPMPEHWDVCESEPAKCPKCGMDLVRVTELEKDDTATGASEQDKDKDAALLEQLEAVEEKGCAYTCPMPVHWDVCESEPGKCPKCGMDLMTPQAIRKAIEERRSKAGADAQHEEQGNDR